MKHDYFQMRDKLIEVDIRSARSYPGSESHKEFLNRLAAQLEELLFENNQLRKDNEELIAAYPLESK